MIVFLASVISFLLLAVSCYHIFRSVSHNGERRDFAPAVLLVSVAVSIGIGGLTAGESAQIMMLEILPALAGMLMLESTLLERKYISVAVYAFAGIYLVPASIHIAVAAGWAELPSESLMSLLCLIFIPLPVFAFIIGICLRLREVKMILKTGTIWANVTLAVESFYLILFLCLSFSYISVFAFCPDGHGEWQVIFPFLEGLMLAALGVRDADDAVFVFWRRQERRILESMKVSKVETAMDPMSIEDIYQDVYERVVAYFESERPFLDNALTINDLAKVLYSNKLYISKAISQFTGRNFCQFVNYYRVMHSMEMFRENHELKIHDLASGSGFNSDVSYNMAFRLFMGETPGEWCKKERNRKIRMKK